ncbi:MAG: sulfotransferase, partial [Candidatus Magasanikbacteria bacterium]
NYKYWAGADEMQNVLYKALPESLRFSTEDSWRYATDAKIKEYRKTPEDATSNQSQKIKNLVKKIILLQKPNNNSPFRFIDKSQSFTVKIGFLSELFKDSNPEFVLVTRNPFAMVWLDVKKRNNSNSVTKNTKLALEHWDNSFRLALKDKEEYNCNVHVFRFEHILISPKKEMEKICEKINLSYSNSILPKEDDHIPFGSNYDTYYKKWHPLRTNVNDRYLKSIPDKVVSIIAKKSSDLIERFDYNVPIK